MKEILIIEDDENLSHGIAFAFEKDGYAVVRAGTVQDGYKRFTENKIALIILDVGLPDGSGVDFCKHIREKSNVPIIMLTARDMETDEAGGFMAGADDYVTKPFSLSVLRARVESVLRRAESKDSAENRIIKLRGYSLDTSLCKFFKGDAEIPVSATEFRLLNYFMSNAGQVLTKEQILAALWDNHGNFVDENTLSVNISRLRSKIETDPKNPKTIKTIHGMGYVWVKE